MIKVRRSMRSNVNSERLRAMKYLEKEREIGLVLRESF